MALQKQQSGVEIMIGLEDESGEVRPVEIDEIDEIDEADNELVEDIPIVQKRKVSISERILKNRNCEEKIAKSLAEQAESRQKELTELLTEHAQLVQNVEEMEKPSTPTSDKENLTFKESTSGSDKAEQ